VASAILLNLGVVLVDVINNLADLGQTLWRDRAVFTGDLFFCNQLFAVAKAAMRTAG